MASGNEVPLATTYPPDISCFSSEWWSTETFKDLGCSVTDNMVDFLNLTGPDVKGYLSVYCLNPPQDDVCPFGFCPNPDIAGPLVRIASESTEVFSNLEPCYSWFIRLRHWILSW